MNKILAATLGFAALMLFGCLTPAFAKNLNYPSAVERIDYINAGGQAEIAMPTLPSTDPALVNYPNTATSMRLSFTHVEVPNAGKSFDVLLVWLYIITTGATTRSWQPFAYITTNTEDIAYEEAFWRGSLVNFDATLFYMNPPTNTIPFPSTWSTDNVIGVSSDVLKVSRHGNDATVTLSVPQKVLRPLQGPVPPGKSYTLPAFSLEVKKFGGSVHFSQTQVLTGYPGASGYTFVNAGMGFRGNGVVTSPTAWLNGRSAENATVVMEGTHTFFSPPAA